MAAAAVAPAFQASPRGFSLSAQLIICPASVLKFLAGRQGQMSLFYYNLCSFHSLWQYSDPIQQSYPRSDLQGKKNVLTHCLKISQFFFFWHFSPIFVLFKLTCLVTLFDRKLQIFENSPKWTIFAFLINFCQL